MPRGVINQRERSLQVNDFSGLLRRRGITPTDLDGYIDYSGNAFLFLEGKSKGVNLSIGQRLCFEHLVDALDMAGKFSCAIVYEHVSMPSEDIDVASCIVSKAYFRGKWVNQNRSVLSFINSFEIYAESLGIKI